MTKFLEICLAKKNLHIKQCTRCINWELFYHYLPHIWSSTTIFTIIGLVKSRNCCNIVHSTMIYEIVFQILVKPDFPVSTFQPLPPQRIKASNIYTLLGIPRSIRSVQANTSEKFKKIMYLSEISIEQKG